MKIVYFGTPHFASYILQQLLEEGVEVVGVVTNPDRPAGRGHKLRPSAVKEVAMTLAPQLPILQPESLRDPQFAAALEALGADLFIVIAFRMMPREVWAMPPLGTFNLHASLLPQYRGAAPIQHAILNDEQETGVTTFLLDEGVDEGKILLQERVAITPEETGGSLHDKLMRLGAEVTLRTIRGLAAGTLTPHAQEVTQGMKYATKIFKEDRLLAFGQSSAKEILLRIRAMSPYPAAIAQWSDDTTTEEIKVFAAQPYDTLQGLEPGAYQETDGRLVVQCREGAVELLEVQFPNKRRTSIHDYLLGNTLPFNRQFL